MSRNEQVQQAIETVARILIERLSEMVYARPDACVSSHEVAEQIVAAMPRFATEAEQKAISLLLTYLHPNGRLYFGATGPLQDAAVAVRDERQPQPRYVVRQRIPEFAGAGAVWDVMDSAIADPRRIYSGLVSTKSICLSLTTPASFLSPSLRVTPPRWWPKNCRR